ncbi:hypothetical protein CPB84DRAFT_1957982 [Gymnopilus junonius]|uniref:Uncharacterized protein n=1 Tax=Gymnopilus junonius TaxID=109634 RepID=A0A9P5P0Z5_GYMJU|nr:hypothetical protein CPB84DRAFT_1957982 [Gymnopilus junonius]
MLISSLLNNGREKKAKFYMDPVECGHILATFCLAAFWLMSSSTKLKVLIEGSSQDTDYTLAFLCLAQWVLNAYFAVHCLVGLRVRFERQIDLEVGISDIVLTEIEHLHILYTAACEHESQMHQSTQDNTEAEKGVPETS